MSRVSPSRFCVVMVAVLLGGCSSGTGRRSATAHEAFFRYKGPAPAADTRHLRVTRLAGLGLVLVDGNGEPFYSFSPDSPAVGECINGPCAASWPLFRLTRFLTLDYTPFLERSDIKIEYDSEGSRLIRYKGQVLHTYVGDTSPGQAKGQGRAVDGGHWYVVVFEPRH